MREDSKQLLGAVMIDSAALTNKKRNGPYFDSEIFDGRFNSHLLIIDIEKNLVISHPEERIDPFSGLKNTKIESFFKSDEQKNMITGTDVEKSW